MKKKINYIIKNEIITDSTNKGELQERFNEKLAMIILNIEKNSI